MKLAPLATLLWLATALPAISEAPVAIKRLTNVIDSYPRFSKDGKLLLFQSNCSGKMQIYVSKADGTDIRQLTHLDFPAHGPVGLQTCGGLFSRANRGDNQKFSL